MYIFVAKKGNQGLACCEEDDELLTQRFTDGTKITEVAKLHSRAYGTIKVTLIELHT